MKHILLFALSIATITAAEPTLEINQKYIGGNYTFSGNVESKIGLVSSNCRFNGKTTVDTFECEWTSDDGFTGSVKVTSNSGSLTMQGMGEQKFTDPMLAIASATGISAGSAHLMYALWKGKKDDVFPSTNIVESKTNEGSLISGSSHIEGNTILVNTTKDNFITSIKRVSDPSKMNMPELSEQDISEVLKATGQPATPEGIESMRKMMKLAQDSTATIKDEIIQTTSITVEWPK